MNKNDPFDPTTNPAYDLIPESILPSLPPLYSAESQQDPVVHLKWFTPDSNWTWYVTEFDPKERLCFGLVIGFERELGYFSLDEIREVRGPMGLPVERDLYFEPTPLSKIQ